MEWKGSVIIDLLQNLTPSKKTCENTLRIISGLSLIISLISASFLCRDLAFGNEMFRRVSNTVENIGIQYRISLINDGYYKADVHAKSLRDAIVDSIRKEYKDNNTRLKEDLKSYIRDNKLNNPLNFIFSDTSYKYMNSWIKDKERARIAIINKKNVLFSTDSNEPLRKAQYMPEILFSRPTGTILTLDDNDNSKVVARQPRNIVTRLDGVNIPAQKNAMGAPLEDLTLVSASYIFEHEDIFGVRNVLPDGSSVQNDQLAVIVECKPIDDATLVILQSIGEDFKQSIETRYTETISREVFYFCGWLIVAVFCYVVSLHLRRVD